ncbi:hypothetical protein Q0812_01620 [Brevundimonas sp. 2R-24]|uniref:PepSY domain-containing protein n=1 Tax=Peiella sedimenti TaxID=3061083 RepID=A0ABT8SLI2_9CAUL|nr:hypothetical protein [Caulobacteraceae bacterium XZ-24]
MLFRSILVVLALAVAAPTTAEAQVQGGLGMQLRQERAREESRGGRRVELGEVVRRLQSSRPGRMLGAREQGGGDRVVYVIRWEYPNGRVSDIMVDARTGAVIGEQ